MVITKSKITQEIIFGFIFLFFCFGIKISTFSTIKKYLIQHLQQAVQGFKRVCLNIEWFFPTFIFLQSYKKIFLSQLFWFIAKNYIIHMVEATFNQSSYQNFDFHLIDPS